MLFAEFNLLYILPIAVFGAIAATAWLMLDWFSSRRPRTEQRLEEIRDPTAARRRQAEDSRGAGKSSDAMTRMLERATPALAKPLTPKNANDANKLKSRLSYAGFRGETAPTIFLGLKFAGLVIGVMMAGGSLLLSDLHYMSLLRAACLAGGMFYFPDAVVWFLGKKRKEAIFLALPDALDLMVVCVEAGLGLDQAMRKVAEEMKKSYKIISLEFGLCNMQLQMGRSRTEVLHELGQRSGVEDLRALASIIIQADKFGSSIAQALRVQSESMRTRRRQIAEEKAAKTAVKLIFPLVIFIFPGIFVVLVGPAAITMVNKMFPAMNGG
ncbi:MAG: type II secretion system F family protein [Pirellulaceae bacterium]